MNRRLDLLTECKPEKVPLEAFSEGCCRHCINAECSRSQFGKSKFDARVSNWYQRLFAGIPKMDAADPRFPSIAGQKFHMIDVGRPAEIQTSSWHDPRDLETTQAARDQPLVVSPSSPEALPQPSRPPQVSAPGAVGRLILANAPKQSGMISRPGSPSPPVMKPSRDPWTTPEPAENVVKPGATVKLRGGSGV